MPTTPDTYVNFEEDDPAKDWLILSRTISRSYAIRTSIKQVTAETFPLQTVITPWTPHPLESLNDVGNLLLPELVIDGVAFTGNPPVGAENIRTFETSAFVSGVCNMFSYNVSLGFGGGTFEFETDRAWAVKGDLKLIAGLQGIVTYTGTQSSNSGKRYVTSGIFGSRGMNKQLMLVANRSSVGPLMDLLPNVYLEAPTASTWTTIAAAAKAIASACNVALGWATIDQPLLEMFAETGMTCLEAIQSLASRVGGIVCWNGLDGYTVISPDSGLGGWEGIPSCKLISPGGFSVGDILDINRSIVLLPVNVSGTPFIDFNDHPLASPPPPDIQTLFSTQFKPKSANKTYVNLPGDYTRPLIGGLPATGLDKKGGKIQIIPNDDQEGPFSDTYVVGQTVDPDTGAPIRDHSQWFDAEFPIVTDRFTKQDKLVVTALPFPTALTDGNYTLNVGFVRDTSGLEANMTELVKQLLEKKRIIESAENSKLRYIKVRQGSINALFWGVIPLPGRRTTVGFDGESITGLIESVQVTNGSISISVGDYVKLNKMTARAALDFFWATTQGKS